jgi:hypothetical protein
MLTFPYWCSETFSVDGKISSWAPVSQSDHDLLERAVISQQQGGQEGTKLVYVDSRRTSADLAKRTLQSCYDFPSKTSPSAPPPPDRRLIRGSWFYIDSSAGKEVPLSEEAGREIEEWFNTIKDGE